LNSATNGKISTCVEEFCCKVDVPVELMMLRIRVKTGIWE